jgi:hypothetical protein
VIVASPADGLLGTEKPRQKNQKEIALLDSQKMTKLVGAGRSECWRAALGDAGVPRRAGDAGQGTAPTLAD